MSTPWKNFEKRIAEIFNTKRTPFSGSNSGITSSDSLHDRVFVECKYHSKDTESIKLMKETELKANTENKIPILALGNPEDSKKNIYVMFNIKDLFNIMKEIDLSYLDDKIPEGTTCHKLLTTTASSSGSSLFEMKEELTIELKKIMREKVISNDDLEAVKSIGGLIYMIDTIMDYEQGGDDESDDLGVE